MVIQRVVMVPPAASRCKGDEGISRGAPALPVDYPVRIFHPDPSQKRTSIFVNAGREQDGMGETQMPVQDVVSELHGAELPEVKERDVIDGAVGIELASSHLVQRAEPAMHGLPNTVACSLGLSVDRSIIQRTWLPQDIHFFTSDINLLETFQRQTDHCPNDYLDLLFFSGGPSPAYSDETGCAFDAPSTRFLRTCTDASLVFVSSDFPHPSHEGEFGAVNFI